MFLPLELAGFCLPLFAACVIPAEELSSARTATVAFNRNIFFLVLTSRLAQNGTEFDS